MENVEQNRQIWKNQYYDCQERRKTWANERYLRKGEELREWQRNYIRQKRKRAKLEKDKCFMTIIALDRIKLQKEKWRED